MANFTGLRSSYQKVCKGFWAEDQGLGLTAGMFLVLVVLREM